MLRGLYNESGGAARDLEAMPRVPFGTAEAELILRGPLAIAWTPDSASCAEAAGVTCVIEGRLYESAELIGELGVGVAGDAELVARVYARFGEEGLARLRGRFCAVLWDGARREGLLAGDLMAVQPFFLRRGVGWLGFAAELRDLLSMLPSRPGPDPAAFSYWLGSGECPQGRTPFDGVERLESGRLVALASGRVETRRYWRPRYRGIRRGSRAEHVAGLREQLDRALRRRLSRRSSAVVLSGGLDSSIVTAVGSQVKEPQAQFQTYSTVFPDHPDLDEGWKVRSLTSALGIEPATFALEPQGALWFGLRYARQWDLPLVGVAALIDAPMAAQAAADGAEVVLDGQHGDEVLGFSKFLVSDRLRRGRLVAAHRLLRRWPAGRPPTAWEYRQLLKEVGLKGAMPYGWERRPGNRTPRPDEAPPWLLPNARSRYLEAQDDWAWKRAASGPRWWRYLSGVFFDQPHRHFRFDYLRHRAAAAGTVNESPLYDFDLVEYCLRLPPQLLFHTSFSRPLAREAMRGLIPDDVRTNNVKANLSPFCFDTLTGADEAGIERLLTAPDAELGAYVDMGWVRERWRNRPRRGPRSTMGWGTQMWLLVSTECWLRAQANPDSVDEMLAMPDVRRPTLRRAVPADTGTFSRLASAEERIYS